DVELLRYLPIADPFHYQVDNLLLPCRQQTYTFCIDDAREEIQAQRFDQVADLFCIDPKLALVDRRDAAAESTERLRRTAEQAARPGTQRIHHEPAIITIQQENETKVGITGVQTSQQFSQMIVIGRIVV